METTFATLKCRMKLAVIRYIGLAKAQAQVTMPAIAFNMRRWPPYTTCAGSSRQMPEPPISICNVA